MGDLICSTKRCRNKVKYYNCEEESYYCKLCAHDFPNLNDCTKIGSTSIIRQMIKRSQNVIEDIKNYVKEEQLSHKWRHTLDQLESFDAELIKIKYKFEETLREGELKDLSIIEQRSIDLKFKITDSESYRKYLFHKEMNEYRLRDENDNFELTVTQVVKDMAEIRAEEHKLVIKERLSSWKNLIDSKPSFKKECKDSKVMPTEKITIMKQQQIENMKSYERLKDELNAFKTEVDHRLNRTIHQTEIIPKELHSISYDVLNAFHKNIIGQEVFLDSKSFIIFNLIEDKWINLLKVLNSFKLPQINYYYLNYVPEDSEEVRLFMRNSIPVQNQFLFNTVKQFQLDGSRYIEELKIVAKKTLTYFCVYNTNLSSKEFCQLISAAKNVNYLYFCYDTIPLDDECDFGYDMKGCMIDFLYLNYSGGTKYSNWKENLHRFENLILAIAKCKPLVNSLTKLYIQYCDISIEKVQEILNKYSLNQIRIFV